jgi:hypothetical protein
MRVSMYIVNLLDVQTIWIKEKVKMFVGISHLKMMKKKKNDEHLVVYKNKQRYLLFFFIAYIHHQSVVLLDHIEIDRFQNTFFFILNR